MTDNHKIEFSFNPTEKQLNEIKDWLIEEMNLTGESFYLNWNSIETAFNENKVDYRKSELVTISKDNETIGFIVWSWHCLAIYSATIEIAAIKQSFRGYGFGTLIVNKLIPELISKNIYAVNLECAPKSSEPFWRHLGFVDLPAGGHQNGSNKRLYKVIIAHSEVQDMLNSSCKCNFSYF